MNKTGTLFLIPSTLDDGASNTIPAYVWDILRNTRNLACERLRTSRRFLKRLDAKADINAYSWLEVGHEITDAHIRFLLDLLLRGEDVGFLSEAGCPGIADPGATLVAHAHAAGIAIRPLVGPSSILLALMASGLNGQSFVFHGYLPHKRDALQRKIRQIAREGTWRQMTHICIEAPYRNTFLFEHLLQVLPQSTWLCIAVGLTSEFEEIRTKRLSKWTVDEVRAWHKKPSVFLFQFDK